MEMLFEKNGKDTVVEVNGVKIGGGYFALISGPCAVESREQYFKTAKMVLDSGANIVRGSVYKPRTSPYSFQGLGRAGLKILDDFRNEFNVPVETEVMSVGELDVVCESVDILRIGARNMQNFDLLKAVGKTEKPVILKRGLCATIEEFLLAAEYILKEGNPNVILCLRGIRTFDSSFRSTLELASIPLLKSLTHLPVIVDPSHAIGEREFVIPSSRAAVVLGADGLIVESHVDPSKALVDGKQSLTPELFAELSKQLSVLLELEKKKIVYSVDKGLR